MILNPEYSSPTSRNIPVFLRPTALTVLTQNENLQRFRKRSFEANRTNLVSKWRWTEFKWWERGDKRVPIKRYLDFLIHVYVASKTNRTYLVEDVVVIPRSALPRSISVKAIEARNDLTDRCSANENGHKTTGEDTLHSVGLQARVGATYSRVPPLPPPPPPHEDEGTDPRFTEQYTKLNIWNQPRIYSASAFLVDMSAVWWWGTSGGKSERKTTVVIAVKYSAMSVFSDFLEKDRKYHGPNASDQIQIKQDPHHIVAMYLVDAHTDHEDSRVKFPAIVVNRTIGRLALDSTIHYIQIRHGPLQATVTNTLVPTKDPRRERLRPDLSAEHEKYPNSTERQMAAVHVLEERHGLTSVCSEFGSRPDHDAKCPRRDVRARHTGSIQSTRWVVRFAIANPQH
ncbi:hypothetical protein K438DRAFT_1767747 [Mycena galopus ATCC 62051]|nr:hypothetical protein K438DRAFT_1767747 [Mycena galopus ATCC 62051]